MYLCISAFLCDYQHCMYMCMPVYQPCVWMFLCQHCMHVLTYMYSKTCLKRPLKTNTKIGFQDRLPLNAGQKYCRMLQESMLQYFRPSLSYHLSLRPLFCQFLSGRLRQVLLYVCSYIRINGCISINSCTYICLYIRVYEFAYIRILAYQIIRA